jgi:hypothetical protein
VRYDKITGQVEPPEVVYLRKRGILPRSNAAVTRGELDNPDQDSPVTLESGDLPDRVVADDVLEGAPPKTRKATGNLTQRQLEQGVPFPVKEDKQNDPEPSKLGNDDFLVRPRGRTSRARK